MYINFRKEGIFMKMSQMYAILGDVIPSVIGSEDVDAVDIKNLVDIGTQIYDNETWKDKYVKTLLNRIGKEVYVTKKYKGFAPKDMLLDAWEYGSIMAKISPRLFNFSENKSWSLTDGQTYEPHVFYQPEVVINLFNDRTTFEVKCSFTDRQLKDSFLNEQAMNSFLSMIYVAIDNTFAIAFDELKMLTVDNFIAQTFNAEIANPTTTPYGNTSTNKAVNLLYLWNDIHPTETLAVETCLSAPKFLKFASETISKYVVRLSAASILYNIGGETRFTDVENDLKIMFLNDFVSAVKVNMESDTFHNELVALPNAHIVPYWQGMGTDYNFNNVSKIHLNVKDPTGQIVGGIEIEAGGILAVMYDREALGVTCFNERVTSDYTASAEFYTNYYKADAGYFNDFNEQFVVFYIADAVVVAP